MNMHRAYCGLTVVTNEQGHTDHAAAVTIGRILCCAYRCRLACDYCVIDCVVCGQRRATIADNRWQYVNKTPTTEGRAFDPGESGISRRSKLLCTVGLLCQHAELVVYDASPVGDVVSIDDVFRRRGGGGRHHHVGLSNPGAVWHDAATDRPQVNGAYTRNAPRQNRARTITHPSERTHRNCRHALTYAARLPPLARPSVRPSVCRS